MKNKKGFFIIFNKWYFIIIGLLILFVYLGDIYNSYDINFNSEALKNKFSFGDKQVEKNYTLVYLTQVKDNLSVLNQEYQKLNCAGVVAKDIYDDCSNLYSQISDLTDIHNSILNGSFVPAKPIVKDVIGNSKDDKIFSITKVKNISLFEDTKIVNNYDAYSKEEDKTLFTKSYEYTFDGKIYHINLELSKNKYNSYSSYQKEYSYYGSLPSNWLDDYYGMFVKSGNDDEIIKEIISEIRSNPKITNNEDELKAVINFVQTIPYDYDSYYNINDVINYPYETIYENKGVCSDVSILLIKLLLELNYETVAFIFEDANHMAVGIKCPSGYGNFGTNYCFIEATGVTAIGYVPNNYGIYGGITLDKNPQIIKFGGSKIYSGIVEDKKEQDELIKTFGEDYLLMNREQQILTEKMMLLDEKIDDKQREYDKICDEPIYIGTSKERTCDRIYNELYDYINDYNDLVEQFNSLN